MSTTNIFAICLLAIGSVGFVVSILRGFVIVAKMLNFFPVMNDTMAETGKTVKALLVKDKDKLTQAETDFLNSKNAFTYRKLQNTAMKNFVLMIVFFALIGIGLNL
jgi:hypothetical protein